MIKHIGPPDVRANGIALYKKEIDAIISVLPNTIQSRNIIHYELGYGDPKTFWKAWRSKPGDQKLVLTLHDPPVVVGKPFEPWLHGALIFKAIRKVLDRTVGRLVIRSLVRRADAIIVLNPNARELCHQTFDVDLSKIFYSPLMTLVGRPSGRTESKPHTILFFGNLARQKGLDVLIPAFRQCAFDHIRLQIVGGWGDNTGYKREVESLAQGLPIDFLGRVSDPELDQLIADADIVVLPYRDSGIVHASGPQMSAMAAGKPVVATNIPIFSADINDGQNGLLVEPENIGELADKLKQVVADAKLRSALGAAASKWIANHHSHQAVSQSLEKVYSSV